MSCSSAHDLPRLALPILVDIRTPATEPGICYSMVGDTSFPLGVTSDLRTTKVRPRRLFDSAHGKISVNVQTYTFVRLPSLVVKVLTPNRREPDQGAERCVGQFRKQKYSLP
jgi:hypothetical protein